MAGFTRSMNGEDAEAIRVTSYGGERQVARERPTQKHGQVGADCVPNGPRC